MREQKDCLREENWASCCSVTKSCPTLCNSMDCSTPGIRIPHYLPEFAQGHVHWIRDGYQTISSSAAPFSSCLQSFPASGSFPMSQLFASGGQGTGASASPTVFPMNIQGLFPLGFTGLILLCKGLSRVFSGTTVQSHQFFGTQPFFYSPALTSIHDYWENHSFD